MRMFGIKDIFTTINLLGGVVAIALCIDGKPFEAGISVLLGYAFGDTLDGYVARKLGTSNAFGAEFDTIADHTSHVIAPAAIVYTVYRDVGLLPQPYGQILAIVLAASMIVSVSIRHARNIIAPVEFKGVWAGLPRTVFGFLAIGYCNASLAPHAPGGWWLGVGIILVSAVITLTYLPFPSHHIKRGHVWYVNVLIGAFFVAMAAMLYINLAFFFDVVFFFMAGYSMSAWMSLTPQERKDFRAAVAQTRALSKS
jgi:phosphatidylserine synthase